MRSVITVGLALLVAAQGAGQGGTDGRLEVTNVRSTFGSLGSTRAELKVLPGEVVHLAFDVAGLQPDAGGRCRFETRLDVEQVKGGTAISVLKDADEARPFVALLGGRTRHGIQVVTGLEQQPGNYRVKVTVADRNGKKETTFTREFTVVPPDFGLVRFQMSYDRSGQMNAPCAGVVGQTLFANVVAVGFQRARAESQGSLNVELNLVDAQDRPVGAKPLTGEFKDIPADTTFIPLRFELPLQRAGQFKLVFKATDTVAKKTASAIIPLTVVE
jgi:hypothetical protein